MPRFVTFLLPALLVAAALATSHAHAEDGPTAPAAKGDATKAKKAKAYPRALIKTSKGDITVELYNDAAPETVRIFLGLAEGKGEFTDHRSKRKVTISKPFFDGLTFHRVIPGFMIQGGCPSGNGTGNAGFMFKDEIDAKALGLDKQTVIMSGRVHPWIAGLGQQNWQQKVLLPIIQKLKINPNELNASKELQQKVQSTLQTMTLQELYELQGYKYTKGLPSKKPVKGDLALANSGPDTNSSQFFINLGPTPHLTGRHTVFGRVIKGMDIVEAIGAVKANQSRPVTPVTITSIRKLP
jgi:peptidyl-prolyl cis-trans isomerase A (cyclophilin A)